MGAGPSCRESGRSLVPRKGDIFCHPGGRNVAPEGAMSRRRRRTQPHPEDAGGFLCPEGIISPRRRGTLFRIHRKFRYCGNTATVPPAAYFFLSCQKKVCKKEAQDAEIALTRRKTGRYILRVVVTPAVKERPSGDRRIRFPERTENCVIVPLTPVEYLTYEIRKRRRVFRLPRRAIQIRICIAFC